LAGLLILIKATPLEELAGMKMPIRPKRPSVTSN
jgi:hypothetical protein